MKGALHLAPIISNPQNVLDVATGTGLWAIEFAEEHPGCAVIGTDLSPIQPEYVPPNVAFEIMDAEDEWTFRQQFDLIHFRSIASCFKDTQRVFQNALKNLVPGTGYMFILDPLLPWKFLTPPPDDCAIVEWTNLVIEAGTKIGMPWDRGRKYANWMKEIGFVDVVERVDVCPFSPWAKGKHLKELSLILQSNVCHGIEGLSLALFTRVLGWSKERLDSLLERVRKELKDKSIHVYAEA